ncbi:MAG: CehA/McbA family metallohydrolase [Chitinophagaceae bacterium]|nr:CehA/McbA family metallohydrolase [Chitinophagaceae bacterium]
MKYVLLLITIMMVGGVMAQQPGRHQDPEKAVASLKGEPQAQPFIAHAVRIKDALEYIGSALSPEDAKKVEDIRHDVFTGKSVALIQEILDPYCIALLHIDSAAQVKVAKGQAAPKLMQGGWKSFLVKVKNEGHVTRVLEVESPSARSPYHRWDFGIHANDTITREEAANRFLDAQMYTGSTISEHLSGMAIEYAIVQLYSKVAGTLDVELGFSIDTGTSKIPFRNTTNIKFQVAPAVKVYFDIRDDDGQPVMAAITITDSMQRLPGKLGNIYPLPSRRVSAFDEYPDFFFQQHIYRKTGEHVVLPPGKFIIKYTRGPEYLVQYKQITIPEHTDSVTLVLPLKRWIDVSKLGWYSADHHVHASGCSHYYKPEEGVNAADMLRQAAGEDLKVSSVLSWGPGWYYQKNNFTGKQYELSTNNNIMQYDVEVSGFPSSHAGHLVLLRLKEDDYPGTTRIEEWPSWTGPILKWAQKQGAVTGYAHSGDGLEPSQTINHRLYPPVTEEEKVHAPAWRTHEELTTEVPNYIIPKMNGIGANEYIVTAPLGLVNFFSAGNTGIYRELNMWYHTLNAGIRVSISGETDFPCLSDERVGYARSYFKTGGRISYNNYVEAIRSGRNYVSDGFSHIMNFSVNGVEPGIKNSLVNIKSPQKVTVKADVAAYLAPEQTKEGEVIAKSYLDMFPCWNIERARIKKSRKVKVELIVNGWSIDSKEIEADGAVQQVQFTPEITEGSWVALRIYASSHTNPVYIDMNNKRVSIDRSIEWCIKSVDRCWEMKHSQIREEERGEAEEAYKEARAWYQKKLSGK